MNRDQARELVADVRSTYNTIATHFSQSRWKLWDDLQYFTPFIQNGQAVLDVGCGNGRLVELFKDMQISYHGTDVSENLIQEARSKFSDHSVQPTFEVLDLFSLDELSDTYDLVLCIAVLQHIPKPLHDEAVSQLVARMKPGAYLCMTNWNLWQTKYLHHIYQNVLKKLHLQEKNEYDEEYDTGLRDVFVHYQQNADIPGRQYRYHYAFTKYDIKRLLQSHGLEIVENFYTDRYSRSNILNGRNILTIAKKPELK